MRDFANELDLELSGIDDLEDDTDLRKTVDSIVRAAARDELRELSRVVRNYEAELLVLGDAKETSQTGTGDR